MGVREMASRGAGRGFVVQAEVLAARAVRTSWRALTSAILTSQAGRGSALGTSRHAFVFDIKYT
jgi:hypothetical protein